MDKKPKAKNVGVSPQAYELMLSKAHTAKPRMKLREYVNIINKLPKNL